jgi:WD40 repeat protein
VFSPATRACIQLGVIVRSFCSMRRDRVTSGGFTPDGKNVFSASEDGQVIFWDPKESAHVMKMSARVDGRFHNGPVISVDCSADASLVASGGADGSLCICNVRANRLLHTLEVGVCVCVCVYPSVDVYLCVSVCRCLSLCIRLSMSVSVYPSVGLSSACLSIDPSLSVSVFCVGLCLTVCERRVIRTRWRRSSSP